MATRTGLLAMVAVAALTACTNGGSMPSGSLTSESAAAADHDPALREGDRTGDREASASPTNAEAPIAVVTALYPVEWLTKEIGGELVTVTNLVAPGQDAHGIELSPGRVQTVADADVVLRVGGLAPAVDEAAAQTKGKDVDIATLIDLKDGDHDHDHGKDDHDHDTDDRGDHDHGHDEHGDDHHHGVDPHFWLDPELMADLAPKIANALAAHDAANASTFTENAAKIAKTLREKDTEWEGRLKGCAVKTIVPTHTAFGYLADAYGLKQLGIKGIDPDSEPAPEHLQAVRDAITTAGVTTVFAEPADTKALAEGVAQDVHVEVATLDPLESLSPDSPGQTYLEVMQANIDAIAKANRC